MIYGKLVQKGRSIGLTLEYYTPYKGGLFHNGMVILNPSAEKMAEAGYYPVEYIAEDGTDVLEDGIIKHYVGAPYIPTEKELREQELRSKLADIEKMMEALERIVFQYGTNEDDKQMALERITMRDELGKLIQTEEGDGTDMNPYKWEDGKAVVTGMWYKTPSDYIWEAVGDGVPESETDTNYFDVVGL